MSMMGGYKANKAISIILSAEGSATPEAQQAIHRLKQIGTPAIPKLIDAIGIAYNPSTIETILLSLLDDHNFPLFVDGLRNSEARIVTGVARVLTRSKLYNPNRLIELLNNTDIPHKTIIKIAEVQKDRISPNKTLDALDQSTGNTRALLLHLLEQISTPEIVPELVIRAKSKDPATRSKIATIISKYNSETSRSALIDLLADKNKNVRIAALEGLGRLTIAVPARSIYHLLRDPDVTVQAKTIETLTKIKDAALVQYLIEILQDESEYIRRAAVEVLNEVGDQRAIKDLLNALRDKDWWVKVRAADALGSIGGEKVVGAVLSLIQDEDEFLRRTAVEILNSSQDERAFDFLIKALEDDDWWVRERAADALGKLGDKRAIQYLYPLLEKGSQSAQVAIKALASIGSSTSVPRILKAMSGKDDAVAKEAMKALENLADEKHVESIQNAITQLITTPNSDLKELARGSLNSLVNRFGDRTHVINNANLPDQDITPVSQLTSSPTGGSIPDFTLDTPLPKSFVDAANFKPGLLLANRYRVIKKVGAGGFGVVILVEDEVVNEQIVLKFLHPNVSADDTMIKRFIKELTFTRKITHPNIIRIYDFITIESSFAISMEYFPSHSLAYELRSKKPLDISRGVSLLCKICQGMAAAQATNVVHRDLKPANILINDNDMVKICDFGVAAATRHASTRITKSGIMIGTPKYMAPEQIRGNKIDARTDIYTLGIVMYEAFCGKAPYKGPDAMATLFKHLEAKATKPRELNPAIPEALEKIILKAMAVRPENRFANFNQLQKSLLSFQSEFSNAKN